MEACQYSRNNRKAEKEAAWRTSAPLGQLSTPICFFISADYLEVLKFVSLKRAILLLKTMIFIFFLSLCRSRVF